MLEDSDGSFHKNLLKWYHKRQLLISWCLPASVFLGITILTFIFVSYQIHHQVTTEKVIIDTDGGPDDLFAILLLLQRQQIFQDLQIIGFTTVNGTQSAEKAAETITRLLKTLDLKIPVFIGADTRISNNGHYFNEGLDVNAFAKIGDSLELQEIKLLDMKRLHEAGTAQNFLLEKTQRENRLKKKTSLLLLGPQTNIAHLVKENPKALKGLHQVVIMGGDLEYAYNAPNNQSEWNFYADAQAVTKVLNGSKTVPTYIVGLKTTYQENNIDDLISKVKEDNLISELLVKLIKLYKSALEYDPVAASFLIEKKTLTFTTEKITIDTNTNFEGKTRLGTGFSVQIAQSLNAKLYKQILEKAISCSKEQIKT